VTATVKVNAGTRQFGFTDLSAELFADSFLVIPEFLELAPLALVEFFNQINKFILPKRCFSTLFSGFFLLRLG
jgi:hypothetical protein